MKRDIPLTIASLLSILLMTFHLADEVVRGIEPGGINMQAGVLILVTWLCGTLALAGRRAGYVVMLLGAIFGSAVPLLHMSGVGLVGGRIAGSNGMFFWVWTLLALGVSANFASILALRRLWQSRKGGAPA
jgi:hypothetical protein